MKTKIVIFIASLIVPLLLANQAYAIVVNGIDSSPAYFGDPLFIYNTPPSSVENNGATNGAPEAFNEQQAVTLSSDLIVDGGFINSGTQISSQLIFLNPLGSGTTNFGGALWTFSEEVLGVISSSDGLFDSDFLGASSTIYPSTLLGRGLEIGEEGLLGDDLFGNPILEGYSFTGSNALTVNMSVMGSFYGGTDPGDWLRVITASSIFAVPLPSTLFLLFIGLISIILPCRKST